MLPDHKNVDDSTIQGNLALLIPVAVGIFVISASWRIFLALAGVSGIGWIWRRYHHQQHKKSVLLNQGFYQLIEENRGRITALDLAMKTQLPGDMVQDYLDQRAKEFSAHFEVTDQGGVLYYFPTVQSKVNPEVAAAELGLGSVHQTSDTSPTNRLVEGNEAAADEPIISQDSSIFLTQAALAKRLNVHANTVGKRKLQPDFSEWSRKKDPDAIIWEYSPETKKFYPKKRHKIILPTLP